MSLVLVGGQKETSCQCKRLTMWVIQIVDSDSMQCTAQHHSESSCHDFHQLGVLPCIYIVSTKLLPSVTELFVVLVVKNHTRNLMVQCQHGWKNNLFNTPKDIACSDGTTKKSLMLEGRMGVAWRGKWTRAKCCCSLWLLPPVGSSSLFVISPVASRCYISGGELPNEKRRRTA